MRIENPNLQLMESKLAECRAKIEELQVKAELTEKDTNPDIEQQFSQLRDRYQDLENHLAQLKISYKKGTQESRDGIAQSWDNLIRTFEKLAARFQ